MKTSKITIALLCSCMLIIQSCGEDAACSEPETDTVEVVIPENQTATVCLDDVYDLEDVALAEISFDGGLGVMVNNDDVCVEITNDEDNKEPDTVIVKHCIGSRCDTTIIIVLACDPCTDEPHDCVPYMPNNMNSFAGGNWSVPNEQDTFADLLVTPSDPGGGYWEISIGTGAPAIPNLIVDNDINAGGAITSGSSAGTSNEQSRSAAFLAYPGEPYTVQVDPFFEGIIEEYPWAYGIPYNFVSKEDCYEPNDLFSQAKSIPKNFVVEAYAIAGHRDYFVASDADQTYDWYKFIVTEAGVIRCELLQSPDDLRIDMRIFSTETTTVPVTTTATSGELNESGRLIEIETNSELQPGTYYLEVHPDSGVRQIDNEEPKPDHWDTTYTLRVTAL